MQLLLDVGLPKATWETSAMWHNSQLTGLKLFRAGAYPEFGKNIWVLFLIVVPEALSDQRDVCVGT